MGNTSGTENLEDLEDLEDLEEVSRRELNKWEVDMYAKNSYLHQIPSKTRRKKRDEIRKRLGLVNNYVTISPREV